MDGKELYRWLQSRESQYSIRDLGCGMLVYKYVIDGYWRTCYLVNTITQTAYEIVGWNLLLKSFTQEDIDMESVRKFEHAGNACRLTAHYPFDIYPFKNGVAYVSWTLYPDGMYFMDEDGFGMQPYVEESIGAYIDTNCKVLVRFQDLVRRAYQAMFEQNERFRIALMSTRGIKLYHSQGEQNPYKTILTESEFCSVLTEMRDSYDINNNETPQRKKRLYFDMDGVLVDFESALAKQDEQTLKEYDGIYDEIPGLFGQMLPMDGAIEAVRRLNEYYDCYILINMLTLKMACYA